MDTTEMLRSAPNEGLADAAALASCITACGDCAIACTACADACLGEKMVSELRRCIRLNLDCADLCEATSRLVARQLQPQPDLLRQQLEIMTRACRLCGEECARHAQMHAHCRLCAEACRRCERACDDLLKALAH
jgi:hypothetical protein